MANEVEIDGVVRVFDRLYEEDWKSLAFRSAAPPETKFRSYTWRCNWWLDQLREGACVGFGCTHEALARPFEAELGDVAAATAFARSLYKEAQFIDPWEGEAYEGTSVLAGMKILQKRGLIGGYRWCLTMDDLLYTVGYKGPVVIGVEWFEGMFNTDANGFVYPTGKSVGGHCLLIRGIKIVRKADGSVDTHKSYFTLRNSWGRKWGLDGDCRITVFDMQILMDGQGDFAIPELRSKTLAPAA